MRNVSWIVSLSLVAACSSETVAPPPKAPIGSLDPVVTASPGVDTVTAKERALPELYAHALSSPPGNDGKALFSELAPLLNPDLAGFASPGMPPAHEPAAIVAAHDELFGAFDDRKMALTRVWRTPSEQTLEWTMTGTHARDWKGIPASHRPVAFKGVTLLWTKDDGSITDVHVYFDVATVEAQLGMAVKDLVPPPPPALPSGPPQDVDQAQPVSAGETRNVALVKSALDALENNNETAYLGAMTDDVEVTTLERATPAHGKADAKAYYHAMHKAIGQLDTTVMGAWGVGQFAIVEYSIAGEQLGPILWIPYRRDRVVRWEVVDVCEIRDGKIARVWRYDDPLQIAE